MSPEFPSLLVVPSQYHFVPELLQLVSSFCVRIVLLAADLLPSSFVLPPPQHHGRQRGAPRL